MTIRSCLAVIAGVAYTVAVRVLLVRILHEAAVVTGIPYPVAV
jgi:hypothetical protein